MNTTSLGEARDPSPVGHAVSDEAKASLGYRGDPAVTARDDVLFELAGPRAKLFFDPKRTRAGIVTCRGLCPGLNSVIRALFFELHHTYGVAEVLGFRGGYQGLDPARGSEAVVLTPAFVDNIHKHGGTILGTSRGPVDMAAAVDNLIRRDLHILFTIGGDGADAVGDFFSPRMLALFGHEHFYHRNQCHSWCPIANSMTGKDGASKADHLLLTP